MQKFEEKDVNHQLVQLREAGKISRKSLVLPVSAKKMSCTELSELERTLNEIKTSENLQETGPKQKVIHFIRHGEGDHNVAQREWRTDPAWDGKSDPYTFDRDPTFKFLDPGLTSKGTEQAEGLQVLTGKLKPDVLITSPLKRAVQTGLLAFKKHIDAQELKVVACELCHEMGGYHTCDKRKTLSELKAIYPKIDFSEITSEEDPYWKDGLTRETWNQLAHRAVEFVNYLYARPEIHIVVTAHSSLLLSVFNAVLVCDNEETSTWFGTGELRTVLLTFKAAP